jgi:ribonuclease D
MQSVKLSPPIWIATPAALQKLADELAGLTRIAVDTESNSLHAFREQLCLIQFSTPQADYLVDSLAIRDLSPLQPVFKNPRIEKIFHAAEYDLICLKRDSGITVDNLFDTMQAARILGCERVGLDSILADKLGIHLDKKYQKADWGARPLSPEMLNYARLDTHHLLPLRDHLQAELKTRGRWELAQEEFIRLAGGNGNGKAEIPAWQRLKGTHKFSQQQIAILHELCHWRDTQAQRVNRPPFKVLDNKRLVAVAETMPVSEDDLEALGLTARQIQNYGPEILKAVIQGKKSPMVSRPRPSRPDQGYLDRVNILSEWRKTTGQNTGLESDLILPKNWMLAIAEKNPRDLKELAALMPHAPWRLENFGGQIIKVLAGRQNLSGQTIAGADSAKNKKFPRLKK